MRRPLRLLPAVLGCSTLLLAGCDAADPSATLERAPRPNHAGLTTATATLPDQGDYVFLPTPITAGAPFTARVFGTSDGGKTTREAGRLTQRYKAPGAYTLTAVLPGAPPTRVTCLNDGAPVYAFSPAPGTTLPGVGETGEGGVGDGDGYPTSFHYIRLSNGVVSVVIDYTVPAGGGGGFDEPTGSAAFRFTDGATATCTHVRVEPLGAAKDLFTAITAVEIRAGAPITYAK